MRKTSNKQTEKKTPRQMDLTEYVTSGEENLEVFWSNGDYPEWLITKGDLLIIGHNAVPTAKDLVLTTKREIKRGAGIRLAARDGIVLVPKNDNEIIGVILAIARKYRGENARL